MLKQFVAVLAVLVLGVAAPSWAAVTIGTRNGADNCYPFACAASDGRTVYQQVYQSSAFNGAITFDEISFFRGEAGLMDSASYDISFYYKSSSIAGLTTSAADNLGPLIGSFGSFTLSGAIPDILTLTGQSIAYDPDVGSLVMDISVYGLTEAHHSAFFQADYSGAVMQRYFGGATGQVDNTGLVTTFGGPPIFSVPEPSSWILLLLGVGGIGAAMRRRSYARRAPACALG